MKHALPTNPQAVVEQVEILRRPGQQIAIELHLSPATVSRILRRLGITVGITVTVHLI
nr:hypothetical protein [Bradyrhizobium erythrophlei]